MPTTTNYIWDEQNYLAESDATNSINVVYTNEPQEYGNLISSRIAGTTSYHDFDGLGSTRQLTNSAGSTIDTAIYDAWGNVVNRTGTTPTALLWIGELGYYSDHEMVVTLVRARLLVPAAGRWLSLDPDRFADGPNDYLYVLNAPPTQCDPRGRNVQGVASKFLNCQFEECGTVCPDPPNDCAFQIRWTFFKNEKARVCVLHTVDPGGSNSNNQSKCISDMDRAPDSFITFKGTRLSCTLSPTSFDNNGQWNMGALSPDCKTLIGNGDLTLSPTNKNGPLFSIWFGRCITRLGKDVTGLYFNIHQMISCECKDNMRTHRDTLDAADSDK
jgi:RHS repeat-associated protein